MNAEALYAGGKGSGVRLAAKSCTISPPQDYPHGQGSLFYSQLLTVQPCVNATPNPHFCSIYGTFITR